MALVASDALVVPLQTEFFALEGLTQLMKTIERIKFNLNPSLDNGEPVEQIVFNLFNLYLNFKLGKAILSESIYFALTPNNVIFSFSAILKSKSLLLKVGEPSNKIIEALDANTDINQFHIIQPQVVK